MSKAVPGQIIGEKKTSLNNHPGLISIVESTSGRVMLWTYVLKNRLYLISLTLNDAASLEQHVKTVSTFRFLSRQELEPRHNKLILELTPATAPQDPPKERPTTDASDEALKGLIKNVVTEEEQYYESVLFGETEINLQSVDDYDPKGNLTKSVLYVANLPRAVRLYGFLKGERVFRETRRYPLISLATDEKEKKQTVTPPPPPETRIFKVKHKYDEKGRLLEKKVVSEQGHELEILTFRDKTVERAFDDAYYIFGPNHFEKTKVTSKLDATGNSLEDSTLVRQGTNPRFHSIPGQPYLENYSPRYRTEKVVHEYQFDAKGNWIKRVTSVVTKDKGLVPAYVTYRRITYYD